jgi:hypothetical protein
MCISSAYAQAVTVMSWVEAACTWAHQIYHPRRDLTHFGYFSHEGSRVLPGTDRSHSGTRACVHTQETLPNGPTKALFRVCPVLGCTRHIYGCGFHTCLGWRRRVKPPLPSCRKLPQLAGKPCMGLLKMGAGFKLGYVIMDNFSGTPHFETEDPHTVGSKVECRRSRRATIESNTMNDTRQQWGRSGNFMMHTPTLIDNQRWNNNTQRVALRLSIVAPEWCQ